MSRREADVRGRDFLSRGKPEMGREARFPPPSRRDRDSRGRDERRDSPRRRVSRSPMRPARDRNDADLQAFRSRSQDNRRRHSVELRPERGGSPVRERRGRSPRGPGRATPPARSPRSANRVTGQAPAAVAAPADFPGDFGVRYPPEAVLASSRNEAFGRQVPMPFSSGPGGKAMEEEMLGSQGGQASIASYDGMLVSRSMVLEDGTVRTFYTLPPDPSLESLPPPADGGLGDKFLPPFVDAVARYGADPTDPRYGPTDGFRAGELSRGEFIAIQDRRLADEKMPGHSQFAAGDGRLPAWPERLEFEHPSAARRERPPSPRQDAFELRSQRRASRSPLRDSIQRFGREGAPNSVNRDAYGPELERSARAIDTRRRGLSDELPFRERLGSPQRRNGPVEDPRVRLGTQRGGPSVYDRDAPDTYPREIISPRDGRSGPPRSFQMGGFMNGPMYEQSRQLRSPPREALEHPRGEFSLQRRGPDHRSGMEPYMSPRRSARLSPRHRRSLTPPNIRQEAPLGFNETDRRAWKRKYPELAHEFHKEGRPFRPEEPEFKRRGREGDLHPNDVFFDRRIPGWGRPDGYIERRAEREGDEFDHGNHISRRPWADRGGSPPSARRFPPYLEEDRRGIIFNGRDVPPHYAGKPYRFQQEGGAFVDRNRLWHDNNMQREFVREDEEPIVPDLPEDSPEFKQQVHRAYMKYAKALNENPGQRKRYEEQGKAGTLLCLACSRFSKPFVDTHSLVMHTHMSRKRGLRAEHLGLCKAICTVMGWNSDIEPANGKAYQQMAMEEAKANKEDLILWPPAVVIHNADAGSMSNGQQEGVAIIAVEELLKELGLSHERIKIVAGRQGAVIVKYLATFSCLHEAEHLHLHFVTNSHSREDWLHVQQAGKEVDSTNEEEGPDSVQEDAEMKQKKKGLYGYLALAHDLDKVDLDFRRRCLIRSRKEIEAIADDSLTNEKSGG